MSYAVAIVRPQTENTVAKSIAESGFAVFNPKIREITIRRGRRVYRTEPLFRRYLFVEVCERIYEVLRIKYLIGLITTVDNTLAVVRDHEIDYIKQNCKNDVLVDVKKSKFLPGEFVQPTKGSFVDLVGRYESFSRNRDWAIFSMLGRENLVSFKQGVLVAA